MGGLIDLTGQTFGIWKVIEQAPRRDNKTRWLCECMHCGGRLTLRSTTLRSSTYARCFGAHAVRRPNSGPSPLRKPPGYAAATELFNGYRAAAAKRGFTFELTRAEFDAITAADCHYCGAPPGNVHSRRHFNGAFTYSGIDRKDSTQGYHVDNCAPACSTCNVMKQDLPYETFLAHVRRIASSHPGLTAGDAAAPKMALAYGGNTRPAKLDLPYLAAKAALTG
jgi:hypothetical protein